MYGILLGDTCYNRFEAHGLSQHQEWTLVPPMDLEWLWYVSGGSSIVTNTPLWWGLLTVPEAVPCVWAGGTRELNSLYSAHLYCELATARKINVYLKKITVREILYLGEKINLNVVLLCLCGPLIFFACVSGPSFLPPPSLVVWKVAFAALLPIGLASLWSLTNANWIVWRLWMKSAR